MQITKLIRKQEDGSFEATLALSQEQTQFLVNFAINVLVQNGMATIVEKAVEEFQEETTPGQQEPTPETVN